MQVFAVFDVADPEELRSKAEHHFSGQHYYVSPNTFFVAVSGQTTKEVGEKLGFEAEDQRGVIVPVLSYWGRHQAELWEWISTRMGSNGQ